MMMAEAMARTESKRTLCLRRSILRMRFIAIACRSGSVASVALSNSALMCCRSQRRATHCLQKLAHIAQRHRRDRRVAWVP